MQTVSMYKKPMHRKDMNIKQFSRDWYAFQFGIKINELVFVLQRRLFIADKYFESVSSSTRRLLQFMPQCK